MYDVRQAEALLGDQLVSDLYYRGIGHMTQADRTYDALVKLTGEPMLAIDPGLRRRFEALHQPTRVNYAFACEAFLRSLLRRDSASEPRRTGHDLQPLFDGLVVSLREAVLRDVVEQGPCGIDSAVRARRFLAKHSSLLPSDDDGNSSHLRDDDVHFLHALSLSLLRCF